MHKGQSFADLVKSGKVNRALYTDPAIFEAEMARIFGAAWLYLGHESQLPENGAFFTTRLGRDRLIVARHTDGNIYAFHNRCAHRGAEVCPVASGTAVTFVCPYHAWAYRTDGSLASLPLPNGYGRDFTKRRENFGLEQIARVESYRGFIFASKRTDGDSLSEFLGPEVRAAFDNFVDRSPSGNVMIAGGKTVQVYRANWKLQIENSIDLLHPRILHANAVASADRMRSKIGGNSPGNLEIEATRANGLSLRDWDRMRIAALPHGHCWMGGFLSDAVENDKVEPLDDAKAEAPSWFSEYRKRLVARHGEIETNKILSFSRHNTIIYPNLFVNPGLQQIRILHPVAVNRTEQHGFIFKFEGAPDELFHTSVRVLTSVNSPASIVTTDDHEVFERIQESLETGSRDWVDWSRGLDSETPIEDGYTGEGTNEILMRNQHRAWVDYMSGRA